MWNLILEFSISLLLVIVMRETLSNMPDLFDFFLGIMLIDKH